MIHVSLCSVERTTPTLVIAIILAVCTLRDAACTSQAIPSGFHPSLLSNPPTRSPALLLSCSPALLLSHSPPPFLVSHSMAYSNSNTNSSPFSDSDSDLALGISPTSVFCLTVLSSFGEEGDQSGIFYGFMGNLLYGAMVDKLWENGKWAMGDGG